MAALTSRLTVLGDPSEDAEDILASALATIYPDDIANTHGDAAHALSYQSPHLPKPLLLHLADPSGETHRKLFSHYLWNASLLLAELIESASLGVDLLPPVPQGEQARHHESLTRFDLRGQTCIELGAGTGLPSLMAALLGANEVTVTDYPSPEFLETVRRNVAHNVKHEFAPMCTSPESRQSQVSQVSCENQLATVHVLGHAWGTLPNGSPSAALDNSNANTNATEETGSHGADDHEALPSPPTTENGTPSSSSAPSIPTLEGLSPSTLEKHHHAYDRVMAADCLWMGSQHDNLAASISFLLRRGNPQHHQLQQEQHQQQQQQHPHLQNSSDLSTNSPPKDDNNGRALIVAGFHTGRQGMRGFLFSPPSSSSPSEASAAAKPNSPPEHLIPSPHLLKHNLAIESIYERDCNGHERPWTWDRGFEDPGERKRWLVVAVLKPSDN